VQSSWLHGSPLVSLLPSPPGHQTTAVGAWALDARAFPSRAPNHGCGCVGSGCEGLSLKGTKPWLWMRVPPTRQSHTHVHIPLWTNIDSCAAHLILHTHLPGLKFLKQRPHPQQQQQLNMPGVPPLLLGSRLPCDQEITATGPAAAQPPPPFHPSNAAAWRPQLQQPMQSHASMGGTPNRLNGCQPPPPLPRPAHSHGHTAHSFGGGQPPQQQQQPHVHQPLSSSQQGSALRPPQPEGGGLPDEQGESPLLLLPKHARASGWCPCLCARARAHLCVYVCTIHRIMCASMHVHASVCKSRGRLRWQALFPFSTRRRSK